jgi:hypothetical protein
LGANSPRVGDDVGVSDRATLGISVSISECEYDGMVVGVRVTVSAGEATSDGSHVGGEKLGEAIGATDGRGENRNGSASTIRMLSSRDGSLGLIL